MFLPYIRYFILCIVYFTNFIESDAIGDRWLIASKLTMIGLVVDLFCAFVLEVFQFIEAGAASYFSNFWNIFDLISISLNVCVILMVDFSDFDAAQIRPCASVAVFFMWVKLFYWMRLFENQAGFIRLLSQIVSDTRAFFLMLIICLVMFANATMILDQTRRMTNAGLIN